MDRMEDKPKTDQPQAEKTTAPAEMPRGLSPREAAKLWGHGALPGERYRPPYSIT
jgi:hypothetical protein